jgi:hypothetical protein
VVKTDLSESKGGSTAAIKSTVDYKDIGIELRVKPLIGTNGVIQLEISQRVEDVSGNVTINGNTMPSISKREATSFVSVCDGDTVVLAGLQERKHNDTGGKLWLLGDIPIIGDILFSPKSKVESTTELIIFIKPTVVSNPANEEAYAKKFMGGSSVEEDIKYYNANGKFPAITAMDPEIEKPRRERVTVRHTTRKHGHRDIVPEEKRGVIIQEKGGKDVAPEEGRGKEKEPGNTTTGLERQIVIPEEAYEAVAPMDDGGEVIPEEEPKNIDPRSVGSWEIQHSVPAKPAIPEKETRRMKNMGRATGTKNDLGKRPIGRRSIMHNRRGGY